MDRVLLAGAHTPAVHLCEGLPGSFLISCLVVLSPDLEGDKTHLREILLLYQNGRLEWGKRIGVLLGLDYSNASG